MAMDSYDKVTRWLFKQLPMYQNQGVGAGYKIDISKTIEICNYIANPEKKIKAIHIAGTNGKGSTAHMLSSIFQEAGYKTGLYTSPHLKDFRERIKINGKNIPKDNVVDFIEKNKPFLKRKKASFFEMTVCLAFDFFSKENVDIAIIEVGMGGRLDSTNVITPKLSIITNISLDHTYFLGDTLAKIAKEKAGIIKNNIPVIIGEAYDEEVRNVFKEVGIEKNAKLYFVDELDWLSTYKTDLLGKYQALNIKTVVAAVKAMQLQGEPITDIQIINGLQNVVYNTSLLGRWQKILEKPLVICDTAHNVGGLKIVLEQVLEQKYNQLHIVVGMVKDKNIEELLSLFPKKANYYFCKPNIPRALEGSKLYEIALGVGLEGEVFENVRSAYASALESASKSDFIFIGGSTFVVAEVV